MRIGIIILFPTLVGDCHVAMLLAMTVRVLLVMTDGCYSMNFNLSQGLLIILNIWSAANA